VAAAAAVLDGTVAGAAGPAYRQPRIPAPAGAVAADRRTSNRTP
jgi:hypothetical protein